MSDRLEIVLESNSTIAQAEAFASMLEAALRKSRPVEFDGSTVERADTAILQLLLTFFREMKAVGIQVEWKASSDALVTAATFLGIASEIDLIN